MSPLRRRRLFAARDEGESFSPASLFEGGAVGFNIYPGTSLTALYQERTGASATTPAGVGDPVGTIHDLITNTYATTTSDATRALLQADGSLNYLDLDGLDDFFVTSTLNFTGGDSMTVWAGLRKDTDATLAMALELSTIALGTTNPGTFFLAAPRANTTANYGWYSTGTTAGAGNATTPSSYTAPITRVLTCKGDISDDLAEIYVNGTLAAQSSGDQGTGNYGNYALYIGRRAGSSLPFNGRIYGATVFGGAATAQQISDMNSYVAARTGVTL